MPGAQKAELLCRPDAEQQGPARLGAGCGKQTGSLHCDRHSVSVVNRTRTGIVRIQMAAGYHIFLWILSAAHHADDIMVGNRAAVEMIADIEFEFERFFAQHLPPHNLELRFVEANIAGLGQSLHGQIHAAHPVIHQLKWHLC